MLSRAFNIFQVYQLKSGVTKDHFRRAKLPGTALYSKFWLSMTSGQTQEEQTQIQMSVHQYLPFILHWCFLSIQITVMNFCYILTPDFNW
jgi:hypothetical protein